MPAKKDEVWLLTYSEHVHIPTAIELANALNGSILIMNDKVCMIESTRLDDKARKIYGKPAEIPTYGEFK